MWSLILEVHKQVHDNKKPGHKDPMRRDETQDAKSGRKQRSNHMAEREQSGHKSEHVMCNISAQCTVRSIGLEDQSVLGVLNTKQTGCSVILSPASASPEPTDVCARGPLHTGNTHPRGHPKHMAYDSTEHPVDKPKAHRIAQGE